VAEFAADPVAATSGATGSAANDVAATDFPWRSGVNAGS